MIYFLPIILDAQLALVSQYVYFFILIIFFAIFNAAAIVTNIFRQTIDDGSELILQSKPISRTILAYAKILLFICATILVACLSSIICAFAGFTPKADHITANNLALNTLIATIVIYCFFGGISILICMFFKQMVSIILTISIFLVLMFYAMIANQIFMSIPKYLRRNDRIYLDSVSLVTIEPNHQLGYHGGVVGSINSQANHITAQSFNDIKPNNDIQTNQFLSYKWNAVEKENNFIPYIYTNFAYQLAYLYISPSSEYFTQPFGNIVNFLRSSNAFNLQLHFDSNGITPSVASKLIAIKYNNANYVLTNEPAFYFANIADKKIVQTKVQNETNVGIINYFNTKTKLPAFNPLLPGLELKPFDESLTSLQTFIDTYLNPETQVIISQLNKLFDPTGTTKLNPLSFYASSFNLFNTDKYLTDNKIPDKNFKQPNNIKEIFNITAQQVSKFQYLASCCLRNKPQLKITAQQEKMLADFILLPTGEIVNNNIVSFAFPPKNIVDVVQQIKKNPEKITEYTYVLKPIFSVINTDELATFNFVSVSSYYNLSGLIGGWMSFSGVLLAIAVLCYFKHDFY